MSKKKNQETGGLQTPKMSVSERERLKAEKEKAKQKEKKKSEREKKPNIFRRIGRTFKEIYAELKKVRWPSFSRAIAQTGVVLGVVIIFSFIVFGIDFGLGQLHQLLTRGL